MKTSSYLTPERLRNLDSYSYSSQDLSPISNYILQPYWRFCASFLPPWLAPNTVTLIGFSAIAINVFTVALFNPDLIGPAGTWVYLSCAFGLFFYQTMDAIDGKQARATGSSSPLGEVVDHGFDTLNCPLGGLIQASAMGLGHSPYTFLCTMVGCWSMFVSTWEEYHTGTLFLGYFNGPVEGVLMAVGILTISGIKGPEFWTQTVGETLGHLPLISNITLQSMMMLFVSLAFLFAHLPLCLLNVHRHISAKHARALSARGPTPALQEAYSQLFPIVAFTALAAVWVLSPWGIMLAEEHMIEFALLVCFLYGQLSSKVIVAQLTKGPFPFSPALLVPLAIPAIGVNTPLFGLPILLPPILEIWYLHLALILSLISYLTSATAVVTAFTTYLNISCFTIPYPGSSAKAMHSPLPTSDPDAAEGEGDGEAAPAGVAGRVKKFGLQGLGMELKEMIGVEGRKRSNTSEREEGLQGGREAAKEARRVARVQ
ncbi:hypothetical protein BCR35DRAFT_277481 [Leucosporidium creatinivorum]|uniref:CDP-alcohol phosphatidyltransferase-domain-containing protein n=1 Tax=Leucosporidium creatinivorum TaxID=106004 RepID=A0A1Y2FTN2_9BASI|nr:hypothetical protein BCR35DRAFT_277481 [Leucosporidium creatinivorum]